jgi:hypothetical protein
MRAGHLKKEVGNPRIIMGPPRIHQTVDNIQCNYNTTLKSASGEII